MPRSLSDRSGTGRPRRLPRALILAGVVAASLQVLTASTRPSTPVPVARHPNAVTFALEAATPLAPDQVLGPGSLTTFTLPVLDSGIPGTREVVEYVPHVADPAALPILYLLHGLPGSPTDLCSPEAGGILDALFRSGVRPFMVVCPNGNSPGLDDNEWADDVSGRVNLETFVTGQVREAVEGSHPRLASMRAIGGFSMGGFAAASFGLRHPDLFGQVVALAGYFQLDDPDEVFGTDLTAQQAHDPQHLVAAARGQRWFLAEAAQDALPLTARAAEQMAPLLRAADATVMFERTPGEHSADWATSELAAVARFLGAGWGTP